MATTTEPTMAAGSRRGGGRAALLLALLVAGAVAAASLALSAGRDAGPAPPGAFVAMNGGLVRVDAVSQVDRTMPMSGPGMSMPMPKSPGVKELPAGHRRVSVDVTLVARGDDGLEVGADDFRLTAAGIPPLAPIDGDADRVFVPDGAALSRSVSFDVPKNARRLALTVRGGERSLEVRLGASPAGGGPGHAHG